MRGIRSKASITGSLPLEAALVKNADGSPVGSPAYADCVYDAASGQWVCDTPAPDGTYGPGSQLLRLKGSAPPVTASSMGTVVVSGGTTTPAKPTWTYNSSLRLLTLAHGTLASSELEYSHDGGLTYLAYSAALSINDNAHEAGDWLGRVKAAPGRTPSATQPSPAIAAKPVGPTPAPAITTVTPTTAQVGYPVTLIGTGFGASQGNSTVDLNGAAATVSTWSDQQVEVIVPAGATNGRWHLTTAGGTATSAADFTVQATPPPTGDAPTITSFTPTNAAPGSKVVLTGTNFTGASALTLNSQPVSYVVNNATTITATLPATATAGPWRVTVGGKTAQSLTNQNITLAAFPAGVRRQLDFEGDSQVQQYLGPTGDGGLAMNLQAALGTTNYGSFYNGGTGGEQVGQEMLGQIPTQFGLPSAFYYDNICLLYAGINDLIKNPSITAQQVYDFIKTWHQTMQALGWLTIACTICYFNQGNDGANIARINVLIDELNTLLRANSPGLVLADVNADPRLDPRTHPENFSDGLHMNYTGGTQLAANIIVGAIRSLPLTPAGSMVVDKANYAFIGSSTNPANGGTVWVDESGKGNNITTNGRFTLVTDTNGKQVWRATDPDIGPNVFSLPFRQSTPADMEVFALFKLSAARTGYVLEEAAHQFILQLNGDGAYFLGATNAFEAQSTFPTDVYIGCRWRFDSAAGHGYVQQSSQARTSFGRYPQPLTFSGGSFGVIQGDLAGLALRFNQLATHQQAYALFTDMAQKVGVTL